MSLARRLFYTGSCLFELAKGVILAAVGVVLIHLFVATIFIVDGASMEPNFHTHQIIIVNRWTYLFGTPDRGDVVVLRFPGDPEHKKYIKRLIGLPGDTIDLANNQVVLNKQKLFEDYLPTNLPTPIMIPGKDHWLMQADDYFMMGDNRPNSNDSRTWDAANKQYLIGKAVFILWPPKDAGFVPAEHYYRNSA